MAWSKSLRIKVMLVIDTLFFFLELGVGFAVGSLALMADAFHMLNDIISLIVGLWAVLVATKATTDKYSYGWLRAEILGAFFNATFLIALCVSIVVEALTRLLDPPEIKSPQLILYVGCAGLASNLLGFFVLGGHGHSHGPGEHAHAHDEGAHSHADDHRHQHRHSHDNILDRAEEGRAGVPSIARQDGSADLTDEAAPRAADLLPQVAILRCNDAAAAPSSGAPTGTASPNPLHRDHVEGTRSGPHERRSSITSGRSRGRDRRRAGSIAHVRYGSIENINIWPPGFRQEIIQAGNQRPAPQDTTSSEEDVDLRPPGGQLQRGSPHEGSPLLQNAKDWTPSPGAGARGGYRSFSLSSRRNSVVVHQDHHHSKPNRSGKGKGGGGHGHSHGDMGMNAMILHVIGDALGNVGVIVTALVIWLTDLPGKYYADPAVSLFITVIILKSAIPLTVAASKILLQATPDSIDLSEVREDIQALPGVISCHHVHIWQLSDTKMVASLHIQVAFPISEAGGEKYMELSRMARRCLHSYGIHSATIQPEFCLDRAHCHQEEATTKAPYNRYQTAGSASSSPSLFSGPSPDGRRPRVGGGDDQAFDREHEQHANNRSVTFDGSSGFVGRPPNHDVAARRPCGIGPVGACLLDCIDDCVGQGCCPTKAQSRPESSPSSLA